MRVPKGIEVRHQRSCASTTGGRCDCSPNYRAAVWDRRAKRTRRKTFGSLADAKRWRQDAEVDLRRGVLADPAAPTVAAASEAWLAGTKRGTIRNRSGRPYKPSSLRGYEQALRDYVEPALGSVKVSELRRADVQRLVDSLVEDGLSASTVRNALLPLRAICRRSLVRGELTSNPTHGLELPAQTSTRDRIASPLEAAALLAALPTADRPIWATAFYAGLRFGEIRSLLRSSIDLDRGLIRVVSTWDRREGPVAPKSSAGLRVVPIARALRDLLEPIDVAPDHLAFGRDPARPFSPSGVVDRAHRLWKAAGLRPINPHECRHTFASLMIAAGVNVKALQVFMGHSSITMTLDLYGHLLPGSENEAAALLDAYLAAATAQPCGKRVGESNSVSSPLEQV